MFAFYRGAALPLVMLLAKRPWEFVLWERMTIVFNTKWYGKNHPIVRAYEETDGMKKIKGYKGTQGLGTFVSGGVTGFVGSVAGNPFAVIKIKMQDSKASDAGRKTVSEVVENVYKADGIRGFWRGCVASCIWNVPACTACLGFYGYFRSNYPGGKLHTAAHGAMASTSMWLLFMPLDAVQTVVMF